MNNTPSIPQPTPDNTQTQTIATLTQNTVEPSETIAPKLTSTPLVTLTPTPLPTEITDAEGVSMVLVPAGKFVMGSNLSDNAKPVHEVYLDTYYIDKYEITNGFYKICVDAGVCLLPESQSSNTRSNYYGNPEFYNYPVIWVNWQNAKAYCEWRGMRLPTEAEWEKAARGTDGRTFPWGESLDSTFANYNQNIGDTTAVGGYENGKSIYGAYDMVGNVWEWVSSLYLTYPYDQNDGRENMNTSGRRSIRGGGWPTEDDNNHYVSATGRIWAEITEVHFDAGFRCAHDVTP